MAETAGHCPSCTCRPGGPDVGTYCDAVVKHNHETFGCLEWKGHDLPHRGPLVPPACPSCHGLETHADDCPTWGTDVPETPTYEVTWVIPTVVELVPA